MAFFSKMFQGITLLLTRIKLRVWSIFKWLIRFLTWFRRLPLKKKIGYFFLFSFSSFCFLFIVIEVPNLWVKRATRSDIYQPSQLPQSYQTGILLGARVYSDGGLSHMTQDRADTAIELYRNHKISKILVSGDHGRKNYDEVNTIKNYLLSKNVPAQDIFMDHAGFDTYDSLYRAKAIFQVESAVIITQDFHLPRSVFISRDVGLEAVGVIADKREYSGVTGNYLRERIAILKAWGDVLFNSQPKFLGETIPITGDSKKSWD